MRVIIEEKQGFIESNAHCVYDVLDEGDNWYYIPCWFRKLKDGQYEAVTFENLPKQLLDRIKNLREGFREKNISEPTQ